MNPPVLLERQHPAARQRLGGRHPPVGDKQERQRVRGDHPVHVPAGVRAFVRPFFVDMGPVYGTCDALVCRAGGTTVSHGWSWSSAIALYRAPTPISAAITR